MTTTTTTATRPLVFHQGTSEALWAIVETTARIQGFKFSADCEKEIKDFLNTGTARLASDFANRNDRREMLFKAQQDVLRIVEMMVKASVSEGQSQVLESDIFKRIRKFFCPCYPFC